MLNVALRRQAFLPLAAVCHLYLGLLQELRQKICVLKQIHPQGKKHITHTQNSLLS